MNAQLNKALKNMDYYQLAKLTMENRKEYNGRKSNLKG